MAADQLAVMAPQEVGVTESAGFSGLTLIVSESVGAEAPFEEVQEMMKVVSAVRVPVRRVVSTAVKRLAGSEERAAVQTLLVGAGVMVQPLAATLVDDQTR